VKNYIQLLFFFIVLVSCARIGTPTGGPIDETPPLVLTAMPESETVNFKGNKIRINFEEFIKFKDLNKQLVISPPMIFQPEITPMGFAAKFIEIKLKDTLKENTTYTFNFGNSIVDNSEGNVLQQYKYLLSTGNFIDSLKLSGTYKDAYSLKTNYNASILLYAVNENYNDSIIYKRKPDYITNSIDSLHYELTHLKTGKYTVIALKDKSANMIYNPKEDEIGFLDKPIELPNDSIVNLLIAKEAPRFLIKKPIELVKDHIIIGYEGDWNAEIVEMSDKKGNLIAYQKTKELSKDTINIWYKNVIGDTLKIKIKEKEIVKDFFVKLHSKKKDSLIIKKYFSPTLGFRDTITFTTNIPIQSIDINEIQFKTNDSIPVVFQPFLSDQKDKLQLLFEKKPATRYQLILNPKAIIDIFENTNDTLQYDFAIKRTEDYGELNLKLKLEIEQQYVVDLLNDKMELVQENIINRATDLMYKNLPPGKYTVRVIFDVNRNNKWDTLNYIEKKQAEKIIYLQKIIDVRANWSINEEFTIN